MFRLRVVLEDVLAVDLGVRFDDVDGGEAVAVGTGFAEVTRWMDFSGLEGTASSDLPCVLR